MEKDQSCRVCGHAVNKIFTHKVLEKHDVDYFECPNCGYVQTQNPTWLDEAYASPINLEDTGILARNLYIGDIIANVYLSLFGTEATYLDYAGGYGILTRHLRDLGYDVYWHDQYTQNLLARGFEHVEGKKYHAISALETFEHFVDPRAEVQKIFTFSDTVIFSTELVPTPTPKPEDWKYFGFSHGQHVGMYRLKSFEALAKDFNLKVYSDGIQIHLLSRKQLIPQILDAKSFRSMLRNSGAEGRKLLQSSYKPLAVPYRSLSPVFRLKEWLARRVMGGFYTLHEAADHAALEKLFEAENLLSPFLISLLSSPHKPWNMLRNRILTPKTGSDMQQMAEQRA